MVKLLKKLEKLGKKIQNSHPVQKAKETVSAFNKDFNKQLRFAKIVAKKPTLVLKTAVKAVAALQQETCTPSTQAPRPSL